MVVYRDFSIYAGGVYIRTSQLDEKIGGHCVCCVGFDDMKQAWLCKNSWGTYWGESGFFRIVRGGNYKPHRGFWTVPNIPEGF